MNTRGRKKGSKNVSTQRFRAAVSELLEKSGDHCLEWLSRVAEDDPKGAIDSLCKLAEYVAPKMARVEHTGKDGEELTVKHMLQSLHQHKDMGVIEAEPQPIAIDKPDKLQEPVK